MTGKEGCIILDFVYNLGGSEALAETFFGVMKYQKKDNAAPETADMRTLINFCIPEVSQCPNAISEISSLYREGSLASKVARHRSNIFYDTRGRASKKYRVSKTIDSLRKKSTGCSYIN